jgi:chromosome partitioning protein
MRKIAVANRKGGVGKTTTAVNLAAGLVPRGSRVLLIDTATQAHCSRLLGVVDPEKGLAELIDGTCTPSEAIIEARDGLFLLAGSKKS